MKRTFTITIITMLMAITAIAKPPHPRHDQPYYRNGSSLELRLFPHNTYTVVMNGIRYYDVHDIFEVSGLTAGSHSIRVIEHYGHHGRGVVVYNGYINIPYRSDVVARVTPHNRIMVQEVYRIPPPQNQGYYKHHHHSKHHNGYGYGYGRSGGGHHR